MLKRIKILNFKGVAEFETTLTKTTIISGTNGVGKTTIYDAVCWCFFGADSNNSSAFSFRPEEKKLDEIETVVEVTLENETVFKRSCMPNFVKKRGQSDKIFSGFPVEYYVNDIKITQTEFNERIVKIFGDVDNFRMLINPAFFAKLPTKKQRDILITISDSELEPQPEIAELLKEEKIENVKKTLRTKKKECDKEIERIPELINENKLNLVEIDEKAINTELKQIEKDIEKLKKFKEKLKENSVVVIEKEIEKLKDEKEVIEKELQKYFKNLENENTERESNNKKIKRQISEIEEELNPEKIKILKSEKERLTKEYLKVKNEKFEYSEKNICHACNQELPEKAVAEAREKAFAQFVEKKESKLSEITANGKEVAKKIELLEANKKELEKEIANKKSQINEEVIKADKKFISTRRAEIEDIEKKIEDLKKQIENNDISEKLEEIDKQILELTEKETELKSELYKLSKNDDIQKRISELKKSLKTNQEAVALYEKQIDMIEEYERQRCFLIEKSVNSKFEIVKFRLFEQQINGGMKEICEPCINNVKYHDLSTSEKIKAGLDIINTFRKIWNINIFCFIDFAESIVNIPDYDFQKIILKVDENHKKINVKNL